MILVTGAAGFIGFHVAQRLLRDGESVHGLDSLNDYYDIGLKQARLNLLREHQGFTFHLADLVDAKTLARIFEDHKPDHVVNLAAQAGVRYSLANPKAYIDSNVTGFLNLLEACRSGPVKHLVFASSSSVYGLNTAMPFSVHQPTDHPVSLYAATKKANELMAHSHSHVYGLPATGLRLFTAYGPWGRPDMALFHFTRSILEGKPIDVYDQGRMQRDFTYIDDIAEGIVRTIHRPPAPDPAWRGDAPDPASSRAPFGSTISATTPRSNSCASSPSSRTASARRRSSASCPPSPPRCRSRTPTPPTSPATSASPPRPRSKPASAGSSSGTGAITGPDFGESIPPRSPYFLRR